jgi:hypothetical protein
MDEFGMWNRALNSTEISTLYNSGTGLGYPFTLPTYIAHTTVNMTGYATAPYAVWEDHAQASREAWKLFNGDYTSCVVGSFCWNPSTQPSYFGIDLGSAKNITAVEMFLSNSYAGSAYPHNFNISYSNDNSTWTFYYGETSRAAQMDPAVNMTNGSIVARYWKVWEWGGDYALSRVRLYESPSNTPATSTINLTTLTPLNGTYTFNATPTFTGNATNVTGTWNVTLLVNNTVKGNATVSGNGVFSITATSLTQGALYGWWFNATDITNSSNTVITKESLLYVAGGTCSATPTRTCLFSSSSLSLSSITSCT